MLCVRTMSMSLGLTMLSQATTPWIGPILQTMPTLRLQNACARAIGTTRIASATAAWNAKSIRPCGEFAPEWNNYCYAQTDSVTGVTSIHCGVAYGWLTEIDEANALLFAYLF